MLDSLRQPNDETRALPGAPVVNGPFMGLDELLHYRQAEAGSAPGSAGGEWYEELSRQLSGQPRSVIHNLNYGVASIRPCVDLDVVLRRGRAVFGNRLEGVSNQVTDHTLQFAPIGNEHK